jgi:hypothetical protein
MGSLRTRAPRSCRTGKSWHRVHGGPDAYLCLVRGSGGEEAEQAARSAESTSGSAFYNALGRHKPGRQLVGSSLFPAGGHGRESALLTLALEAKPTLTEFGGYRHAPLKRIPTSLGRFAALRTTSKGIASTSGCPPIDLSSLGCGGRHQPHLPPLSPRVEKRPITHRQSSVARANVCAYVCFARLVPESAHSRTRNSVFFLCEITSNQAFSRRRDCRN